MESELAGLNEIVNRLIENNVGKGDIEALQTRLHED